MNGSDGMNIRSGRNVRLSFRRYVTMSFKNMYSMIEVRVLIANVIRVE